MTILRVLLFGILSTVTMDVAGTLLAKLGATRPLPPELLFRWLAHAFRGRLVHSTIADSPNLPAQVPTGVAAHYVIGIALAAGWWLLARAWPPAQQPLAAILYGVATTAFAWFLMFPAMGFGLLGANAPAGTTPAIASVVNHLCFGLGLALWSRVVLKAP